MWTEEKLKLSAIVRLTAIVALLVGIGLSIPISVSNDLGLRDGLVTLVGLALLHFLLLLLFALGNLAVSRGAASLGAIACMYLLVLGTVNLVLRFPILYAFLRDPPYLHILAAAGWLVLLPTLFFAAIWTRCAALGPMRRRFVAATWLAALVALVLALLVQQRPGVASDSLDSISRASAEQVVQAELSEGVLLIGLDGLDWNVLAPLIRAGRLPTFERLTHEGAAGVLQTTTPTYSPILWNSISTGVPERKHGIHAYSKFKFPLLERPIGVAPRLVTFNWINGLNRLSGMATKLGVASHVPFTSRDREAPTIWEIADHYGLRVGVSGWYTLRPIHPLRPGSFAVAGLTAEPGSCWPRDWATSVIPRALDERRVSADFPDEPILRVRTQFLEDSLALHRVLQTGEPPSLIVDYQALVDVANHLSWRGNPPQLLGAKPAGDPWTIPSIVDAHVKVDSYVATLLAAYPHHDVLIVSDHGFQYDGNEHHFAPPGVVLMAGPRIQPGIIEGGSIFDVTPTVLHLLGLPRSDELAGRIWAEVVQNAPPNGGRVASYDWFRKQDDPTESPRLDEEELERLRSLGYVN